MLIPELTLPAETRISTHNVPPQQGSPYASDTQEHAPHLRAY
jgi:hypothetical protein